MYKPQEIMKPKKLKLELNKETIEVLDKQSMLNINGAEKETSHLIYGAATIIAGVATFIHDQMDEATNCPFGPCTNPGGGGTQATQAVEAGGCLLCEVEIKG